MLAWNWSFERAAILFPGLETYNASPLLCPHLYKEALTEKLMRKSLKDHPFLCKIIDSSPSNIETNLEDCSKERAAAAVDKTATKPGFSDKPSKVKSEVLTLQAAWNSSSSSNSPGAPKRATTASQNPQPKKRGRVATARSRGAKDKKTAVQPTEEVSDLDEADAFATK